MFFIPAARNTIKSTSIEQLEISPATNQALVTYKNGNQYLYSNIDEDALFDVIFYNVKSFGKWVNDNCKKASGVACFPIAAWFLSLIKQHIYNIMTQTTLTPLQEIVSNIIETDAEHMIDMFINELRGYGLDDAEDLENAYSGCFPSVEAFSENLVEDCYGHELDKLPIFLQSAVDYEMVWHQSLQYDYFEIYFNYEYYFFNRNV